MLYDDIEVLGHKDELDESINPYIAPRYKNIQDLTGLKIHVGPDQTEFDEVLRQSAGFAAYPLAMADRSILIGHLKNRLANSLRLETDDRADSWKTFAEGYELALSEDIESERQEAATRFWLRSFLYAGLAKVRQRPFVPDAVRTWGLPQAATSTSYGQDLEKTVQEKYTPGQMLELIPDAPFPIPPFAAAVFIRAGNDRRRVAEEMRALRETLAPVRSALSEFQGQRDIADYRGLITIFGKASTLDSKTAVDHRVRGALHALRQANLPVASQFLVLKPMFDMLKSATSLFTNVLSPAPSVTGAAKDIYDLASKTGNLKSWEDDSSFVEVHHRLGWTLRQWFNSGVRLKDLFGPIQDDEPRTV